MTSTVTCSSALNDSTSCSLHTMYIKTQLSPGAMAQVEILLLQSQSVPSWLKELQLSTNVIKQTFTIHSLFSRQSMDGFSSKNSVSFTCVFPPVLSCMAVLERAVLAANDRKDAPNMLLTPKARSSCYIQVSV